jgi:NAD(P) transhydrogenase subunit beta
MLSAGLVTVAYLAAAGLFILSLSGLSQHETARRGNLFGMIGMALAIFASIAGTPDFLTVEFGVTMALAALIGLALAARVQMTSMPELVAVLHSFVGLSAVLVALSLYLHSDHAVAAVAEQIVFLIEVFVGAFIGALTFTGSIVAFLKLRGTLSSKPLLLPGRHLLNLGLVAGSVILCGSFIGLSHPHGFVPLLIVSAIAGLLGYHLVAAIGGADMPVVVSMLNSYSGWAAAASGFSLGNDLLIITGALVGSSGAILSFIMCKAMNRSIWNVIFGGFGAAPAAATGVSADGQTYQEISPEQVAEALVAAKSVIIIPGYGMAVAQAQHPVRSLKEALDSIGVKVRFAIHPVAGRLPGHMNVLLAEANIPYDSVLEMDEINEDFPETDMVIVVGANDIVNPGALDDKSSPIFGMPVLHCWNARQVIALKRGRAAGYSGVENPLFFLPNTQMLLGDAKNSIQKLVSLVLELTRK